MMTSSRRNSDWRKLGLPSIKKLHEDTANSLSIRLHKSIDFITKIVLLDLTVIKTRAFLQSALSLAQRYFLWARLSISGPEIIKTFVHSGPYGPPYITHTEHQRFLMSIYVTVYLVTFGFRLHWGFSLIFNHTF